MSKYVICNKCGKKITEKEFPKKDYVKVNKTWGYFSNKDLECHQFHLCEKCYDKMVGKFKIKPKVKTNKKPII